MLAYILRPQNDTSRLSKEQEEIALNYAAELSPDFLSLIIFFKQRLNPFQNPFLLKKLEI